MLKRSWFHFLPRGSHFSCVRSAFESRPLAGSAPKLPKGSPLKVPYMGRLGRCYTEGRPREGEPFKTIEGDQLAKQLDEYPLSSPPPCGLPPPAAVTRPRPCSVLNVLRAV